LLIFTNKHLVSDSTAYLQDTPDLLPVGSFPVSIDVMGQYTNIPQKDRKETETIMYLQ
jgi:hypothetical protein